MVQKTKGIMDNKLIAEFMGNEWHQEFFQDVFIISPSNITYKFDTDWNWLMPVVEKIENTKYFNSEIQFSITKYAVSIQSIDKDGLVISPYIFSKQGTFAGTEKRNAIYIACVEFIKWYYKND